MRVSSTMKHLRSIAAAFAGCAALFSLAPSALAQEFYKNKTVNFIIGFSINNGYDTYSRAVARHIGKYLPGKPNVIVQNMPGAGSLAAINNLYNAAAKDGTVLGMIDQAAALTQLLDPKNMRADITKFNWIGRVTDNSAILYGWHTAPVKKISDALEKELIIATTGQNSRMLSALLKNMLGYKFKMLNGYAGAAEAALAMERGEIHALTQPWPILRAEKPDWIRDKKINLLLQVGVDSHPELSIAPLVTDLARNDEERRLIEFIAGNSRVGRAIVSPPGQPPERVADLRKAFMQVMQDPDFLAEIKRDKLDLAPLSGEDLQRVIARSLEVSPEMVAKAKVLAEFTE
jgi:tripartite-type tricarboxylate transporter receptor subunit TctC